MATRNTVTRSAAGYTQPVKRLTPQPGDKREHAREVRMLNLSDAEIVVRLLNAAREAPERAGRHAYKRITDLLQMLIEFGQVRTEMNRTNEVYAKLQFSKTPVAESDLLAAGRKYEGTLKQADKLHHAINDALGRYLFRPLVTYTVVEDAWRGGLIPHANRAWFCVQITQQIAVGEPDAAMSLVRLHLTGELSRVRLCETCRERWRVAAKSNYRFCSAECRERFYTQSPDYHERKARNQAKHRQQKKIMDAAKDAALLRKRS